MSISCTDYCKKLRFSGFVGPIVSTKGKTFFGFNWISHIIGHNDVLLLLKSGSPSILSEISIESMLSLSDRGYCSTFLISSLSIPKLKYSIPETDFVSTSLTVFNSVRAVDGKLE